MKLFEIGDGLKSIKVSSNYFAERENDGTVILYDPEIDFAEIRISVITVESKDSSDLQAMYRRVIELAKEKEIEVNLTDEKSYYNYVKENEEDGLMIFYFEVGYFNHLIIISVTTNAEYAQNNEENIENVLSDITNFISTIKEINIDSQHIFEPTYNDIDDINERIKKVLNIHEDEIDAYHDTDKTISLIQKIIDENVFQVDNTYELQSLGIALGDYIQYKNNDFHWAVIRDEYGRDICLQYKTLALTVFPMTMISKRIEDGENVNVSELFSDLLNKINELVISGDFTELDHND
ncbi:DUF3806 domain-containing protein [Flavobacterium sp. F-65]|uniref:DUF3806 domain-containing protein n=1 Tax=Flavobacterium pisciphilum TaxID=2893755 RepID=A0ABS8MWV1_9FLAO|nr:DUF3806 domain-containing protein [Flavobacterium sp. F-65]MCC9073257.1 DUF3806 domain-containing protein [Flavobacterium sp. F-65]